jgi:hypothetical protein
LGGFGGFLFRAGFSVARFVSKIAGAFCGSCLRFCPFLASGGAFAVSAPPLLFAFLVPFPLLCFYLILAFQRCRVLAGLFSVPFSGFTFFNARCTNIYFFLSYFGKLLGWPEVKK